MEDIHVSASARVMTRLHRGGAPHPPVTGLLAHLPLPALSPVTEQGLQLKPALPGGAAVHLQVDDPVVVSPHVVGVVKLVTRIAARPSCIFQVNMKPNIVIFQPAGVPRADWPLCCP